MNTPRCAVAAAVLALFALLPAAASAADRTEIKGAAILAHACGKTAVKHMGLVHAGKMDEAVKLGTPKLQQEFKDMPADQRAMMTDMMKEMSQTEAELSADIEANGVLVVEGDSATLTIEKKTQDANGSSTETTTQKYVIDAQGCWITH